MFGYRLVWGPGIGGAEAEMAETNGECSPGTRRGWKGAGDDQATCLVVAVGGVRLSRGYGCRRRRPGQSGSGWAG